MEVNEWKTEEVDRGALELVTVVCFFLSHDASDSKHINKKLEKLTREQWVS